MQSGKVRFVSAAVLSGVGVCALDALTEPYVRRRIALGIGMDVNYRPDCISDVFLWRYCVEDESSLWKSGLDGVIFLVGAILLLGFAGSLASRGINGNSTRGAFAVALGTAIFHIPYMAYRMTGTMPTIGVFQHISWWGPHVLVAALLGLFGGFVGRRFA